MVFDVIGIVSLFFALAGWWQSVPAAEPQAVTSKKPSVATMGQELTQGDVATIIQSRSTNTRGYKVVIHEDGSATAQISGWASFRSGSEPPRLQEFPAGTIDVRALHRLLTEIGDVSKIPTGGCAKSVSFGTRTQLAYAGRTSGDLQCIRQQALSADQALLRASKDLSKFVSTTLAQLKIDNRRAITPE
ncbi:MAG TPA: hypothetical protein VEK33_19680 [Terriglobales bacterium]|nr:hypothetical protein [Terriglobales bacterium]